MGFHLIYKQAEEEEDSELGRDLSSSKMQWGGLGSGTWEDHYGDRGSCRSSPDHPGRLPLSAGRPTHATPLVAGGLHAVD